MANYGYYNGEELTGYDKYLLQRNRAVKESASVAKKQNAEKYKSHANASAREYDEYDKYLYAQLSRTSPSNGPVLTKEEFYGEKTSKPAAPARKGVSVFDKLFGSVKFKKGGKLIFIAYVIIVISLASILIIANTTDIASPVNANAAPDARSQELVTSMTVEEESEENNWFDRLCDAINK